MKQFFLLAIAIFSLAAPQFGQSGSVEQQIRNLDKQNRDAALHGDPSFEERYTTSDYMAIGPSEAISNREQALARARSADIKLSAIDVDDEHVRVYGDSAIVTGRAHIRGVINGQNVDAMARYTRVWVKQHGSWKLAAFQETPITQPGS